MLFRRRPDPRGIRLVPLATRTIRFDEVLSVPQAASRPIWAEIEITPNRLGRLIASAFKPLPVTMTLALENGTEKSSRINPGSVRDGFLMSPFLANDSTLHSLDADDANGWRPHAVKSIRVEGKVGWNGTQTRLESKAFYNDEIEVRLFGVVFEPPPTGDAAAKTGEGTRIGEETPGKRIPSELTGM